MSVGVTAPNSRPVSPARTGSCDRRRLEPALDLAGVVEVADLADLAAAPDRLELLLAATGPCDREAAGHQVVAAVAVLDLDHVAGGAEAGTSWVRMSFIVTSPSLSAPCEVYGSSAISRAVLDRVGDVALVLRAVAGDPAGPDLAAVGDELPQQAGVLVVDVG